MASGKQQGTGKPQLAAAGQEFDPKYEWQENATTFILRLHLSGFRKEDFRVQVDGSGRLTVRGQKADGSRFNKVFQLPATSNLDAIAGRFDTGVLTLTVPKKAVVDAKPKEDASKAPPQGQAKPKEEEEAKKPQTEHKEPAAETAAKKAKDDAKPKEDVTSSKKPSTAEQPVDAKGGKPQQEQRTAAATPPATVRKEEAKPKPKPEAEAAAPPSAADKEQAAAPRPPQPDAERKAVDPESLAAVTARRRAEEERAKAAAAAEEAERQRTTRRGFRERVQEELQGLAGSEWAEDLLETVKKNKEVIVAAVAAFSLGLFVSSRLCSRN